MNADQAQQLLNMSAAIQQYAQESDNIHKELLSHAAFQSNCVVAVCVILIVLSFICAFRRANR